MTAFFTAIGNFFFGGGLTGPALLAALAMWVLGYLAKSKGYRSTRAAYGKACERAGVLVDAFLGRKLALIWNPLEQFILDWVGFGWEQFAVGLRKNDASALVRQADRLDGVGSNNRLAMIRRQLEEAIEAGRELPDDPVTHTVLKAMNDSAAEKLRS